jgi:type II secretory pathway pseudopilin PulG
MVTVNMQRKNRKLRNQGSAMVVAIVVGVVIMVFVLSLLLLSYSLFSTAAQKTTQMQCRELAKSVNKELRQEILSPDYDTYASQLAAEGTENNLWFYLRYNLWQEDVWPYYNEEESGHGEDDSYRYFTIDTADSDEYDGIADTILITMYWEIESDNPQEESDKSLTLLHVQVEVKKGDCSYSMESVYALTVAEYSDAESAGGTGNGITGTSVNPYNQSIDTAEKWIWTPD